MELLVFPNRYGKGTALSLFALVATGGISRLVGFARRVSTYSAFQLDKQHHEADYHDNAYDNARKGASFSPFRRFI